MANQGDAIGQVQTPQEAHMHVDPLGLITSAAVIAGMLITRWDIRAFEKRLSARLEKLNATMEAGFAELSAEIQAA